MMLSEPYLDEIKARWEAVRNIAGESDVIRVSESNSEADMYLWIGPDLAPSAVYHFVAAARQDLPALLVAARQ